MSWGIASRSGIAVAGLAAVMAVAPGCVLLPQGYSLTGVTAVMLRRPPSEEKLSRLAPSDRQGVACRIPWAFGQLTRYLPLTPVDPKRAANRGSAEGVARVAFTPSAYEAGPRAYPVMVFSAFDVWKWGIVGQRGSRPRRLPLAHWTHPIPEGSDCVDLIPELKLQTLLDIRRGSPFFRVAKARYGATECAAVTDCVPIRGRLHRTVELYSGDPRASPCPDHVLLAYVADPSGKNWGPGPVDAFAAGGKVFRMRPPDWGESGPSEIVFDEFQPMFEDIIDGKVDFLTRAMGRQAAISYLNNFLLTWKTKGMPARLRGMSVEELEDLAIRLEKSILRYDMESKKRKDAAQAKVVEGGSGEADMQVAHLLDQRKTLLLAILKSTKQVLAVRRRTR